MDEPIEAWTSSSPEETLELGKELIHRWDCPRTIGLLGPLGSGKTTFMKGTIEGCGGEAELVRSPTYTLLQHYDKLTPEIIHVDLYRTENSMNQRTIGLTDYFNEVFVFVEWADRWQLSWPEETLSMQFKHLDRSKRKINLFDAPPDQIHLDDDSSGVMGEFTST